MKSHPWAAPIFEYCATTHTSHIDYFDFLDALQESYSPIYSGRFEGNLPDFGHDMGGGYGDYGD